MDPTAAAPSNALQEHARTGARLILKGIAMNLVLAAAKFAGGVLGNTYALIADGVESLLDVATSVLVWFGFRWSAQPADADHPFGHGKAEGLAALLVAFVIFGAAGWIAVHAVREIITPHAGPHWATLPLLAFIVGSKGWFSRRMMRAGRAAGSTALGAEGWHHLSDALTSAAAFIGILVAVVGGEGYEAADDWAALAACSVIVWNGLGVFRQGLDEVMDIAVSEETVAEVRRVASEVPGVRGLDKCRIRKSGISLFVDLHVRVDGEMSVRGGHRIAHAVKDALLAGPVRAGDVTVHVEPHGSIDEKQN